jgi:glucose-6-phosphate isomerase
VDAGDPETTCDADDLLQVRLVPDPDEREERVDGGSAARSAHAVEVFGSLGAQLLLWEFATAAAGRVLGINPFDQPDVEAAKTAARGLLDATPEPGTPDAVIGSVEMTGPAAVVGAPDVKSALAALARLVPEHGYLAVQAYLDRLGYPELETLRDVLARESGRPVTFGWGPRFLHSTGQYHKGGPAEGVFLQITADSDVDLAIPGRPFTFGQLIAAQAAGDATVLREHGLTVVRLHLTDRGQGIAQLLNGFRSA